MSEVPVQWIVVADRAGARFFRHRKRGKDFTMEFAVEHPQGKLKDQDIDSDRPGTTWSGKSQQHTTLIREQSAHAHVMQEFCRELADRIERGAIDKEFDQLVIVAESRMLGALKSALGSQGTHRLTATIEKDLARLNERDLAEHLRGEPSL